MKTVIYVAFVFFGDLESCERFVEGRELRSIYEAQCLELEAHSELAPVTSPRPRARPW